MRSLLLLLTLTTLVAADLPKPGQSIDDLPSSSNPTESFAVSLPPGWKPGGKHPCLVLFSLGGGGKGAAVQSCGG
jgi:hypothetical protein